MNFRSRDLLNLCYEFDCLLRIDSVCTGGTGEPCHANWPEHGKGAGMKAHDCYAVPGCRACHMALDQGSKLSGEQRKDIWLRAFWKYLPQLWQRGLLIEGDMADMIRAREVVNPPTVVVNEPARRCQSRKRISKCVASSKQVKRPAGWQA
jgi:hypothetical protein